MCFSTSASFGAAVVLTVIGIASVKKIEKPSQILYASMPLLFASQQFIEGFVWLSLTNSDYASWQSIPVNLFLFFAQVLWPIWVPLSIFLIEENKTRKLILAVLVGIGILLSAYISYCMFNYSVDAYLSPYHVNYVPHFPSINPLLGALYFLPIFLPSFVSSIKTMFWQGTLLVCSYVVTKLLFNDAVISVWCFFAALVSIMVFYVMRDLKLSPKGV